MYWQILIQENLLANYNFALTYEDIHSIYLANLAFFYLISGAMMLWRVKVSTSLFVIHLLCSYC
jgi:hypothetical protein